MLLLLASSPSPSSSLSLSMPSVMPSVADDEDTADDRFKADGDKARIDAILDDAILVRLCCGRFEKYGRLLAKVSSAYSDSLSPSFGEVLLAERLRVPRWVQADQGGAACRHGEGC